jgi:UDPglucose--hexose-1-phosphate uridylyltransferase
MSELRTDWLTGRTVILAEHRAERPNEFVAAEAASTPTVTAAPCPFCPGQESTTPPAVFSRAGSDGRWRVRVVPNKFPAVAVDEPATGAHEVIIESSQHADRMSALGVAEFSDVLDAYRERLTFWRESDRFQYGLIFKNQGAQAGASLAHVHSQLVALPLPPVPVAAEFERAQAAYRDRGNCPYCRMIHQERKTRDRVVLERDGLIAFCPYASLQPGEVWLMPTTHEPWFEARSQTGASDRLAEILHTLLVRVEAILPRPAYNLLVRTSPWQNGVAAFGHWRIEILPRTNPFAGFELATHIYINPISPTRAARQLRSS